MTSPTGVVVVDLAQFSQALNVLMQAGFIGAFVAVCGGYFFGSLIFEGVHIFLLRRSRTWRRFQRAMRKVMS